MEPARHQPGRAVGGPRAARGALMRPDRQQAVRIRRVEWKESAERPLRARFQHHVLVAARPYRQRAKLPEQPQHCDGWDQAVCAWWA